MSSGAAAGVAGTATTIGIGECVGACAVVTLCSTAGALLCCSDEPVDGDPRGRFSRSWQTDMLNAPCVAPDWFCCAVVCEPCVQYKLREWALGGNMSAYRCCQGYFDNCCFQSGSCGDEGNPCCLVVEAILCPCFAVQATRFYVMDTRNIAPSGTDNKLIRFNNFLQLAACLCRLMDCDGADALSCYADLMWTTLLGCMTAQVAAELRAEAKGSAQAPQPGMAPQPMVIGRYTSSNRQVTPAMPTAHGGYPGQQPMAMPVAAYGYPPQCQPVATYGGYPQGQQLPMAMPVGAAPQPMAMARPVQGGGF